jgi:hypothetical protein
MPWRDLEKERPSCKKWARYKECTTAFRITHLECELVGLPGSFLNRATISLLITLPRCMIKDRPSRAHRWIAGDSGAQDTRSYTCH